MSAENLPDFGELIDTAKAETKAPVSEALPDFGESIKDKYDNVWEKLPSYENTFLKKMRAGLAKVDREAPPEFLRPLANIVAGAAMGGAATPREGLSIPTSVGSFAEGVAGSEDPYSGKLAHMLQLDVPNKLEQFLEKRFEERGVEPSPFARDAASMAAMGIKAVPAMLMTGKNYLIDALTKGSSLESLGQSAKFATDIPFLMKGGGEKKPLTAYLPEEKAAFARMAQKYGLSEEEITPLIQGDKKEEFLKLLTSGGKELTKSGEGVVGKLVKAKDRILGSIFKGYEAGGGGKGIMEYAERTYQKMVDSFKQYDAVKVKPKNMRLILKNSIKELKATKGNADETLAFIKYLERTEGEFAAGNMSLSDMGNSYREFTKEFDKSGTANKHMHNLKEAMKQDMASVKVGGKSVGKEMLNTFEETNLVYSKAHQFEKIEKQLANIFPDGEANFKKMDKILDNDVSRNLFEDVLGKEATRKLREIAEVGKKSEDVIKAFEGKGIEGALKHIKGAGGILATVLSFINPKRAATFFGSAMGGEYIGKKLLMDPKYQNLWMRTTEAANKGKWEVAKNLANKFTSEMRKDYERDQKARSSKQEEEF